MKIKIVFLLTVLSNFLQAQTTDDTLVYKLVKDSLPSGYTALLTKQGVVISKTDSVFTVANFNNTDEMVSGDVPQNGAVKMKYILTINAYAKWTDKQIKSALKVNEQTLSKIYEKYKIAEIKDSMDVYFPKNEDEQARLLLYYDDCEHLQPSLIKIPNFASGKYSFAIVSAIANSGRVIIPYKVSSETSQLENKLRDILRRHFSKTM